MKDFWLLNDKQFDFLFRQHRDIETAYMKNDMEALGEIENSDDYKLLFGNMSWDESYDRYEYTLGRKIIGGAFDNFLAAVNDQDGSNYNIGEE